MTTTSVMMMLAVASTVLMTISLVSVMLVMRLAAMTMMAFDVVDADVVGVVVDFDGVAIGASGS